MIRCDINESYMKRMVLIKIADCLKSKEWLIYLREPAYKIHSISRTVDYEGSWGGIADKNGCVLIFDQYDNRYSETRDPYTTMPIPHFEHGTPSGRSWHIESKGQILACGNISIKKMYHEDLDGLFERYESDKSELTTEELAIIKAYKALMARLEKVVSNPTTAEVEEVVIEKKVHSKVLEEIKTGRHYLEVGDVFTNNSGNYVKCVELPENEENLAITVTLRPEWDNYRPLKTTKRWNRDSIEKGIEEGWLKIYRVVEKVDIVRETVLKKKKMKQL